MPRFVKRAVLVGIVLAAPQLGLAQDREFPVLNSVGRYFGIGYTRGGYHAAHDGRLDIVTSRHPASDYRGGGLRQPYLGGAIAYPSGLPTQAIDSPWGGAPVAPTIGNAHVGNAHVADETSAASKSSVPEAVDTPVVTPPKPAGPPPTWLRDYLQDEQRKQDEQGNQPPATSSPKNKIEIKELAPEASPSDVLFDDHKTKLLPTQGVTYTIVEPGLPAALTTPASPPMVPVPNRYLNPNLPRY